MCLFLILFSCRRRQRLSASTTSPPPPTATVPASYQRPSTGCHVVFPDTMMSLLTAITCSMPDRYNDDVHQTMTSQCTRLPPTTTTAVTTTTPVSYMQVPSSDDISTNCAICRLTPEIARTNCEYVQHVQQEQQQQPTICSVCLLSILSADNRYNRPHSLTQRTPRHSVDVLPSSCLMSHHHNRHRTTSDDHATLHNWFSLPRQRCRCRTDSSRPVPQTVQWRRHWSTPDLLRLVVMTSLPVYDLSCNNAHQNNDLRQAVVE